MATSHIHSSKEVSPNLGHSQSQKAGSHWLSVVKSRNPFSSSASTFDAEYLVDTFPNMYDSEMGDIRRSVSDCMSQPPSRVILADFSIHLEEACVEPDEMIVGCLNVLSTSNSAPFEIVQLVVEFYGGVRIKFHSKGVRLLHYYSIYFLFN